MTKHTSGHLSLALNFATRSCVVTGVFCIKTALISSSVTGTADGVPTVLEDDDVPFEGKLFLEAGDGSSLTEDFCSWL